jgi:endonuclease YncB( thermonuclease family)
VGLQSSIRIVDAALCLPLALMESEDRHLIAVTSFGVDIRLCGIDAPEKGDIRYKSSRSALRDLATGRQIRCVRVGDGSICDGRSRKTNHDRIVAQCFIGNTDIADVLVSRGYPS